MFNELPNIIALPCNTQLRHHGVPSTHLPQAGPVQHFASNHPRGCLDHYQKFNYLIDSMEQSSKIDETSTNIALAMPNGLPTASLNINGTESLLASSHVTEDTFVEREAQETFPSYIPSTSPNRDEECRISSAGSESQDSEDASSIYYDAAESIRYSSSFQVAIPAGPIYHDAVEFIPSSSSSQRPVLGSPEFSTAENSSHTNSDSMFQGASSSSLELPTAKNSSDENSSDNSGDDSDANSDKNPSLLTLKGSRHLDRRVSDVSARTSTEKARTTFFTHFAGVSFPKLNVEEVTPDFDAEIATDGTRTARRGATLQRTIGNDASLPYTVAPARCNYGQNDGAPRRKMSIHNRIKGFFMRRKQPKDY
ncbi:hypothetical protein ACMFMG_003636 [Clarireedia jacksonii]